MNRLRTGVLTLIVGAWLSWSQAGRAGPVPFTEVPVPSGSRGAPD